MNWQYHRMKAQLSVLKDLEDTYSHCTITDVIQDLYSRIKQIENYGEEKKN